jgi:phytol kinase
VSIATTAETARTTTGISPGGSDLKAVRYLHSVPQSMNATVRQNIIACLAGLVYIKSIVAACEYIKDKQLMPADVTRKIIHVAAGCWCLSWPFFDTSHWTWQLNVLLPAIYTVQLFVKGVIIQDPEDTDVKTMSRSGKPIELCEGPIIFTLVMIYCGLYQYRTQLGVCIMAGLGFGDGIAPLIGARWPIGYYRSGSTVKSYAGSIAVFLSTFLGVRLLESLIVVGKAPMKSSDVVTVSLTTTVAEALSGKWDNIGIPLSIILLQATKFIQV